MGYAKKLYFFVGTEAELIKVMPVMKELSDRSIKFKIIASGQNNIQNSELLQSLKIKEIDIVLHQGPIRMSAISKFLWFLKTLPRGVKLLGKEAKKTDAKTAYMIVHGDTISSVMGALIAKYHRMRIAHIEAGLRSFHFLHPFPEEIDRVLVSYLADIHFCPYESAVGNIKKRKGVKVNTSYNTLVDSLAFALSQKVESHLIESLKDKKYFIFVLHRQENLFDERLVKMLIALLFDLSEEFMCVFVMHEPTQAAMKKLNILDRLKMKRNILFTPRLPFAEFIRLLNGCEFIMTDGGSNQQESSYLGKPCLILRATTESEEGVGNNMVLSGNDSKIIKDFMRDYKKYKRPMIVPDVSPSKIIVDYLSEDHLGRLAQ